MLAFPLLELGQMKEAEEAAKRGFEINNQDGWSQHAVGQSIRQYLGIFALPL